MSARSKQKGNAGERELAKKLGDALGGSFVRVPNSGAFIGGSNASRAAQMSAGQVQAFRGDIIPPDHLPKLVIESKSYADFPYHALLCGPVPLLDKWIAQTTCGIDADSFWLTCWKTNRKPWHVAMCAAQAATLGLSSSLSYTTAGGRPVTIASLESVLTKRAEIEALSKPDGQIAISAECQRATDTPSL